MQGSQRLFLSFPFGCGVLNVILYFKCQFTVFFLPVTWPIDFPCVVESVISELEFFSNPMIPLAFSLWIGILSFHFIKEGQDY